MALAILLFAQVLAADAPLVVAPGWQRVFRADDRGELHYSPPVVGERDYPQRAKRAGVQGEAYLRAIVATDGSITRCWLLRSSGDADLDAATCPLFIAKARFRGFGLTQPAIVQVKIAWRLA